MLSLPHVFEDDLRAYSTILPPKAEPGSTDVRQNTLKALSSKDSPSGSDRIKRRALANITNSGANPLNTKKQGSKLKTQYGSLEVWQDTTQTTETLPPERLIGPTAMEQEIAAQKAYANEIDARVRLILNSFDCYKDDCIVEISRETEDEPLIPEGIEEIEASKLFNIGTLPEMDTVSFLGTPDL